MMKTIKQRLSVVTSMLLACYISASAQHLQASLSHYSTQNGLASNAISYLAQDDYGYIWIATWNGLSRFDGYNFFNYKTGPASYIPRLHNRILDLTIDNQQNVWMRMYDGRVFVLKRSTDTIIDPFEGISGSDEYRTLGPQTGPLTVTTSGYMMVPIEGVGLFKMRMEKDGINSQLITTAGLTVTSMAEGYQSDIWLGTNQGVHRMDAGNLTIERKGIFTDEHVTALYSNGYNIYGATQSGKIFLFSYGKEPQVVREGGLPINALYVDSHGLIWFADTRQGVLRLNPETGDEKLFEQQVNVPDYDGMGGIFREVNGILWARMNHGGFGYYNREEDEIEYFHNDPSNPWNLSNTVNASLVLNEGVVWESTSRRGLEKLEIMKNTITREMLVEGTGESMDNEIRAMYYDSQRKLLLIGNKASTVFIFNDNGSKQSVTRDDNGNPIGRIYGISKDSKGNYWLSSKDNGIFKMSMKAGGGWSLTNYRHDANDPTSMSANAAYATVEDKQGNIWVATFGGGVNVMTTDRNGKTVFLSPKNGMNGYPYNAYQKARTIEVDKDGCVWAGTTDGILLMSCVNGKVQIEKLVYSEEYPENMMQSNDVVCLGRDNEGEMWIGTNGGGLSHTIGKDSKGRWLFETFGAKDGLPSEEIRSITFDQQNNVWFATDNVLCSFNTSKQIFTTFSHLDGVDDTMCSEGGAITLGNGNILIGTINGYYVIDRKKLENQTGSILKLRITDFWLNDVLQSPRLTDNFNFYIPDCSHFEIPSHSDMIGFRFAALNYQLQHRVHYQYIMEGYDNNWQNADQTRAVYYTNLPTGTYTFKVKAFLLESPDKFDQKSIIITIPPYFLLSSKAIWLYMAIMAAVLLWFIFWLQRRLRQKEQAHRMKNDQEMTQDDRDALAAFIATQSEWLEDNYSNSSTTAEKMIDASGINAKDYREQMVQATGMSPREFVDNFRLEKALKYLEETNDSMADIAFNTGLGDIVNLTRLVKNKTDMTPSQYRDKHRKTNDVITDGYEIMS